MTLRLPLKSLTFLLLILSANAAAQLPQVKQESELPQAKQESEEEKARARKELKRKALALLDETLQGTQTLKLGENRAAIRAQAADLIWTHDEKRARALFREAVTDLVAAQNAEGAMRERGWMLSNLRSQMLYTVAARDPQLALELLRESRPQAEDGASSVNTDPDQELRMEQSLSALAAEADPKAAFKMAEESLSKGVTFGALGALNRLRLKDSELATKLAGDIVAKLSSDTLNTRPEASMVAIALLRSVLMPQSPEQYFDGLPPAPRGTSAEKPKPLVLEDGDLRDLSEALSSAALNRTAPGGGFGLLMQLRPLMPELEKRVPARAAQLRQRLAEMDKVLGPSARDMEQYESAANKSPDALLEEAAKAPSDMKNYLYTLAIMKLVRSGDTERARQIASDNLRGQEREQMLSNIDMAEAGRALEKGDTDAIRAIVSRIKSKERRASALAEFAVSLAKKGERKSALLLLEEARALVNREPENEREVEALLEVARGYALIEPAKTFELIDPLIDRANEMLSAAALLGKFGAGGGLFRKGEMILSPGLDAAAGPYARYVSALTELARVDFDRTRTTADRFNRDDARLAARLVVARSVLSDKLDASGGLYSSFDVISVSNTLR